MDGSAPLCAFTFSEAAQIRAQPSGLVVIIPSTYFETSSDGDKYIKIDPRRNKQIAQLLLSACPKEMRAKSMGTLS